MYFLPHLAQNTNSRPFLPLWISDQTLPILGVIGFEHCPLPQNCQTHQNHAAGYHIESGRILIIPSPLEGSWDEYVGNKGPLPRPARALKLWTDEVRQIRAAYLPLIDFQVGDPPPQWEEMVGPSLRTILKICSGTHPLVLQAQQLQLTQEKPAH